MQAAEGVFLVAESLIDLDDMEVHRGGGIVEDCVVASVVIHFQCLYYSWFVHVFSRRKSNTKPRQSHRLQY